MAWTRTWEKLVFVSEDMHSNESAGKHDQAVETEGQVILRALVDNDVFHFPEFNKVIDTVDMSKKMPEVPVTKFINRVEPWETSAFKSNTQTNKAKFVKKYVQPGVRFTDSEDSTTYTICGVEYLKKKDNVAKVGFYTIALPLGVDDNEKNRQPYCISKELHEMISTSEQGPGIQLVDPMVQD